MAQLGKRLLTLTIDGTERSAEVSSCEITTADTESGFVTFANAAAGGSKTYKLKLKFVQDPSAASLWDEVWTHAGDTVPCVVHPAGGATADATHPSFTGNVIIAEPSGTLLGGEAATSAGERWTVEVEWEYIARPVRAFA